MKNIALVLICLAAFSVPGYCQSAGAQDLGEDIKSWLKEGEYKVELMGIKTTINPRSLELTGKVMKAASENAAWIRDSMALVTDTAVLYAKFGLTKAEYQEYIALNSQDDKKQELVKTGDETLVIRRKKNTLTFKGTGRLKDLDSLKFNLVLNEPIYNGKELEFSQKQSKAADGNNPFNSPWTGYHFSYETVEDFGNSVADMSATTISFDIGKLQNNGKVILMFMLFKVVDGKPVKSATLICQFNQAA
jgi:hypothetical protein